jgi:hypothetical protein
MSQEVKTIKLKDLVLWTENPRDPIDPNATDQDIVDKALSDRNGKWTLKKLSKEMGDHYDFSELPTVVYENSKPVVYDGNRRIILGKIQHKCVKVMNDESLGNLPTIPQEIPCNVCSRDIALKNVYRKHAGSGSWTPLDRDIFVNKFMLQGKSTFLLLDEVTGGMISKNPHLNKVFVRDEIFTDHILRDLGFEIKGDKLYSKYSSEDAHKLLSDLSQKIASETISTRKNRGKVKEVLEPSSRTIIEDNAKNSPSPIDVDFGTKDTASPTTIPRKTRRVNANKLEFFGGTLYLQPGEVSNLYRDILDLHSYYETNKKKLSDSFPCLIRMSMRLLCEAAAQDKAGGDLDKYIKSNFSKGKTTLGDDAKTYLSSNNVTESSLPQQLHIGAHNYTASKNIHQTVAISIILGAMLTASHGKS